MRLNAGASLYFQRKTVLNTDSFGELFIVGRSAFAISCLKRFSRQNFGGWHREGSLSTLRLKSAPLCDFQHAPEEEI
jgi:hypothetical protein